VMTELTAFIAGATRERRHIDNTYKQLLTTENRISSPQFLFGCPAASRPLEVRVIAVVFGHRYIVIVRTATSSISGAHPRLLAG
jgi:hypothetical protein